jgi:hypothetical protein
MFRAGVPLVMLVMLVMLEVVIQELQETPAVEVVAAVQVPAAVLVATGLMDNLHHKEEQVVEEVDQPS